MIDDVKIVKSVTESDDVLSQSGSALDDVITEVAIVHLAEHCAKARVEKSRSNGVHHLLQFCRFESRLFGRFGLVALRGRW